MAHTHRPRSLRAGLLVAAILVAGSLAGAGSAAAVTPYSRTAPMILQGPSPEDLAANKNGICTGNFTHVIRNVGGAASAKTYLDVAAKCDLKVILFFSTTADHSTGVVYPTRVAPLVNAVKAHPALFGYMSVKEPSWVGITAWEIRTLYKAYKAADPAHPVVGLWGDIPHFGMSVNPYTAGMADIVMVGWYPVETTTGTNTIYLTTGPTHFKRVRSVVAAATPGRPIWLLAQTHKYLKPATHKKQRPSQSLLSRQVREAFVYLGAKGIGFHTWSNVNYTIDQRRDPTMVAWMNDLARRIQAGTFQ
ncbi:MAG TPA: hypothetical protein VGQ58_09330 [Candidatus Limnocylindrales bacterium]|jgi:hypothetical protein|nr:hypothetical protein [Candidatus Limnocylindrales bacterium]